MGKIWLTSDLHFGHDRMFVWGVRGYSSVEEMNEAQVEKWNAKASDEDDIYVLGDFMLGDKSNIKYIERLKGNIHLVYGNHDTDARKGLYGGVPQIVELAHAIALKYKKHHFFMTHYPCLTGNLEKESLKQCTLNLFGHTHQTTNFYEDRPYMYHVGVDSHPEVLVDLDDIIEEMYAKVKECEQYLQEAELRFYDTETGKELQEMRMKVKSVQATPVETCRHCEHEATCPASEMNARCSQYKFDPVDGGFYG